jgi:putative hydrolase of the HAD superfamily
VVFDVGGVLVQAERTWLEDAESAGFSVSSAWLEELDGRTAALPSRSTGAIDRERYFVLFAEASDGVYAVDDARRISKASLTAEYSGVSRVFDALDSVSMPSAVPSNVNDEEWSRFFPAPSAHAEFPTLARARYRFASHLMGLAKPDVRVFRALERETGYSGDAILFFDDRLENVEGARSCGWTADLIDHAGDTAEQLLLLLRQHHEIP